MSFFAGWKHLRLEFCKTVQQLKELQLKSSSFLASCSWPDVSLGLSGVCVGSRIVGRWFSRNLTITRDHRRHVETWRNGWDLTRPACSQSKPPRELLVFDLNLERNVGEGRVLTHHGVVAQTVLEVLCCARSTILPKKEKEKRDHLKRWE